ncbi:unnamed protein product [Bubo scandiacus]
MQRENAECLALQLSLKMQESTVPPAICRAERPLQHPGGQPASGLQGFNDRTTLRTRHTNLYFNAKISKSWANTFGLGFPMGHVAAKRKPRKLSPYHILSGFSVSDLLWTKSTANKHVLALLEYIRVASIENLFLSPALSHGSTFPKVMI